MSIQYSKLPLIGGVASAIGASLCCAGPLVLIMLGVSGSWISGFAIFDPLKPYFILITIILFTWVGWGLYKPQLSCQEGDACSIPKVQVNRRRLFWVTLFIATTLVTSAWWIPLLPESWLY